MNEGIIKTMEAIAGDVLRLVEIVVKRDSIGTNPKTAKNTLKDSSLSENARADVRNDGNSVVIDVFFDNYLNYLEQGRAPRTGKQPPIDALRDWALARKIPTDNSTLFLISRAIWRDGYEGRPIMATLEEELEKAFDERWGELLLEKTIEQLIINS